MVKALWSPPLLVQCHTTCPTLLPSLCTSWCKDVLPWEEKTEKECVDGGVGQGEADPNETARTAWMGKEKVRENRFYWLQKNRNRKTTSSERADNYVWEGNQSFSYQRIKLTSSQIPEHDLKNQYIKQRSKKWLICERQLHYLATPVWSSLGTEKSLHAAATTHSEGPCKICRNIQLLVIISYRI